VIDNFKKFNTTIKNIKKDIGKPANFISQTVSSNESSDSQRKNKIQESLNKRSSCIILNKYMKHNAKSKSPEKPKETIVVQDDRNLPVILDASGSFISNLQISTMPVSDEKLIQKYMTKLKENKNLEGNTLEIANLFEEFFEDLCIYMPQYDTLFSAMKKLANSIKESNPLSNNHVPISPKNKKSKDKSRNLHIFTTDTKLNLKKNETNIISCSEMALDAKNKISLSRESPLNLRKTSFQNPSLTNLNNGNQHKYINKNIALNRIKLSKLSKVFNIKTRNSMAILPKTSLQEYNTQQIISKNDIIVPKLKLQTIEEGINFNDEFNAKINEFSESWREAIKSQKTIKM